jgi:hypothetical protein
MNQKDHGMRRGAVVSGRFDAVAASRQSSNGGYRCGRGCTLVHAWLTADGREPLLANAIS